MTSASDLRRALAAGIVACVAASVATAQESMRSRVQPVSGPVRHAGVYHLATGTWTRNASVANLVGADTIYDNTCVSTYFAGMQQNERFSHRSCVPSPTHPTVATVVPGANGDDETPGCRTSYLVDGFQVGYCSTRIGGGVAYELAFQDHYTLCGAGGMSPPASSTFALTGLPGGTSAGGQVCWMIDVDLNAASLAFTLVADGTGTYASPSTVDQFGVRWSRLSSGNSFGEGPMIAGNYTWLGGTTTGPLAQCTGTDGTIWDSPVNLAEQGTGMASSDFFRVEDMSGNAGCFFFGGNPRADFHLELYSSAACGPPAPGVAFCEPGASGVMACVCGNPNSPGVGCGNTGGPGANLSSLGTASLASDASDPGSVTLTGTSLLSGSSCVHLQGNALVAAGTAFGAGVRCAGGSLKRLYIKPISSGVSTVPQAADRSISNRSADLGDVITPASTRWYQTYYRDPNLPNPGGSCPAIATFNISSGQEITWSP